MPQEHSLWKRMLEKHTALFAVLAIGLTVALWMRPFSWALRGGEPDERDFGQVIGGSHCLFHSCDPYDSQVVSGFFHDLTGHGVIITPDTPVYPPSAFALYSPFLLLRERPMFLTITVLSAVLLLASWVLLILKFDLFTSPIAYLPILCAASDRMVFDALWIGQPVVIAAATGAIGVILLVAESSPFLGTLFLGASLAIKPQLCLAPALYLLLRKRTRRYSLVAIGIAAFFFLLGSALLFAHLHSFAYFAHESANMKQLLQPGHLSDSSTANSYSGMFLNLQATLNRLIPNMSLDNLLTRMVSLAFLAGLAWAFQVKPEAHNRPYTAIALLVLVSLIAVYHRRYDDLTIVLIVPALWELRQSSRLLYWSQTALTFLWIFNHKVIGLIFAPAHNFPYAPLVEVAMCGVLLASLFMPGSRAASRSMAGRRSTFFDMRLEHFS